eukprot:1851657-Rhodomonas_salina.1
MACRGTSRRVLTTAVVKWSKVEVKGYHGFGVVPGSESKLRLGWHAASLSACPGTPSPPSVPYRSLGVA